MGNRIAFFTEADIRPGCFDGIKMSDERTQVDGLLEIKETGDICPRSIF